MLSMLVKHRIPKNVMEQIQNKYIDMDPGSTGFVPSDAFLEMLRVELRPYSSDVITWLGNYFCQESEKVEAERLFWLVDFYNYLPVMEVKTVNNQSEKIYEVMKASNALGNRKKEVQIRILLDAFARKVESKFATKSSAFRFFDPSRKGMIVYEDFKA